ncbi:cullin-like protein, putative [Hepatocystis sp. ex Piliocolobus tephrosceles]|nr:cullin-like protein, putative [Hepatocystis sp. ex Piliocolobus tephrosceles]
MDDPHPFKNYPNFNIIHKDVNVDYKQLLAHIQKVEEYISIIFECLPYNKLQIYNDKKFLIERFCDFFVYYNCHNFILTVIKKQCENKINSFFTSLDAQINNKEFEVAESFLEYFINTWNNFVSVILHLEDILSSFFIYNKIPLKCKNKPVNIFVNLWELYMQKFINIKHLFMLSICKYLKLDRKYSQQHFYDYICMDVYGNEAEYKEINDNNFSKLKWDKWTNNNDIKNPFNELKKEVIDIINENDNGRFMKIVSLYDDHYCDRVVMDSLKKKTDNNSNITQGNKKIANNDNSSNNNNNNNNDKNSNSYKIKSELLILSKGILDKLSLYGEFEAIYLNEVYTYYEKIVTDYDTLIRECGNGNSSSNNSSNNSSNSYVYDLPIIIEKTLSHEYLRCFRFLKSRTQYYLIKILNKLLVINLKEKLFDEEYIKDCIINEKYDSLRSLHIFSDNLNIELEFANLFFNASIQLGTNLISNLINKRNDINLLNNYVTQLVNLKLNIDRCIIISFHSSDAFKKNWKKIFECILNKGTLTEHYMPIILSLYLNNSLIIYNTCLNKIFKNSTHNNNSRTWENTEYNLFYDSEWSNMYREKYFSSNNFDDTVSTDSDCVYFVKKMLKKKKKKKKSKTRNVFIKKSEVLCSRDYNNSCYHDNIDYNNLNSDEKDKILQMYLNKMENRIYKYRYICNRTINLILTIISLFKYLNDKEKFEKFYRLFMCKRLINKNTFNIVLDVQIYKILKTECGTQFTNKIETILKDVIQTTKLNQIFYYYLPNTIVDPSYHGNISTGSNSGSNSESNSESYSEHNSEHNISGNNSAKKTMNQLLRQKKYSVNIIFCDIWDYNKIDDTIIYPESIKLCNHTFFKFYKFYNKSKNITFLPLYGLCTMKVNLKKLKKRFLTGYDEANNTFNTSGETNINNNCDNLPSSTKHVMYITLTIIQAIVLLLFNEKNEYNLEEITNKTGLLHDNIVHYLKTLYLTEENKLLIYDEYSKTFKLNELFHTNKKHLTVDYADTNYKINTSVDALNQYDSEFEDKSLHIDASIVRFLKTSKKASEKEIYAHVKNKLKIMSVEQIKTRIDSLVTREFIFLHNDKYCYEL